MIQLRQYLVVVSSLLTFGVKTLLTVDLLLRCQCRIDTLVVKWIELVSVGLQHAGHALNGGQLGIHDIFDVHLPQIFNAARVHRVLFIHFQVDSSKFREDSLCAARATHPLL